MAGRVELRRGCTFEERGDVPHVDAAGLHELPQGDLQEEDGDPSHEDDQQVGDQEDACGGGTENIWGIRTEDSTNRQPVEGKTSSSCPPPSHQGAWWVGGGGWEGSDRDVHLTKSTGNL